MSTTTPTQSPKETIDIYGAREHNLKNLTLKIPRNKLVVITGVSGSGKSSLAFDTIYAEGKRRYMESFMSYIRTFLGGMRRPDVDKIEGLSSVIAIEQKTTSNNPKSTVGTATDIYDFMRLLYAKCAEAYSYKTGEKLLKLTEREVFDLIYERFYNKKVTLLAPMVRGRKGHHKEIFAKVLKSGFSQARIDGTFQKLTRSLQLDRYKVHDIDLVVDKTLICDEGRERLQSSLKSTWLYGKRNLILLDEEGRTHFFSKNFISPTTGESYEDPSPNTFSFNSPYGACSKCQGTGEVLYADLQSIIPDKSLSIADGAIVPLGAYRSVSVFVELDAYLKANGFDLKTPISQIPGEVLEALLYGGKFQSSALEDDEEFDDREIFKFGGVLNFLKRQKERARSSRLDDETGECDITSECPACSGKRLKREALCFKIDGCSIADLAMMNLQDLFVWMQEVSGRMTEKQRLISSQLLVEMQNRLKLLVDMGLDYLHLNRPLTTLSGGESQRVRLATQIGTQLVGVLYILDEPSVGLHQRDNDRLIESLRALRDLGNSVIVVEHDRDIMLSADYLIDIGPGAGPHGGYLVGAGDVENFLTQGSETAKFLSNQICFPIPKERRVGNGSSLVIKGCTGHNLENIDVEIPLGAVTCITGPSGSGKSSLINSTLVPAVKNFLYKSNHKCLPYGEILGIEHIKHLVEVDQAPIGRTPRSNPATYTGIFNYVRDFFTMLPESKIRGYKPSRFSFNVKGGRCPYCEGDGLKTISMSFMDDVHVPCDMCRGMRYNKETLEIKYRNASISDVLEMTIDKAIEFFDKHPHLLRKLNTISEVGLGYMQLGQHSTTLSGGEAQRIKLATELAKRRNSQTLYVLDEPSTGLHFSDIAKLMQVVDKLVSMGNSVVIVEHNLDIIKLADYVIDLGPGSGPKGGEILAKGTPEDVAMCVGSVTGTFLKKELN